MRFLFLSYEVVVTMARLIISVWISMFDLWATFDDACVQGVKSERETEDSSIIIISLQPKAWSV